MSTFNLVQINNPLDPRDCHVEQREFTVGQSLAELFPVNVVAEPCVFTINGQVIENTAEAFPLQGDYVTRCPIPTGGGSAKSILRVVAMIALVIAAPELAYMITGDAGAVILGAGITLSAATTAAVVIGGGMLINALLPPPKPKAREASEADSPTYGIDGAKNTSLEGAPVPLCYGTFRYGGNILSNYTINDGDTQWLYMLLNAGEGEVAPISEDTVLVNDQPLSSYASSTDKPEFEFLSGRADQNPPKWFGQNLTPINVSKKFTTDWGYMDTNDVVDSFRVDVTAPNGIFYLNDDGSSSSQEVHIELQYRPWRAGTNNLPWADFENATSAVSYASTAVYNNVELQNAQGAVISSTPYTPQPTDQVKDGVIYDTSDATGIWRAVGRLVMVPQYASSLTIVGKQRTALRRSFVSPNLTNDRYEIRYRRSVAEDTSSPPKKYDTIYVADLVAITNDKVAYRNTATVALRFKLSDHLNGIPTVTYLHTGKLVSVYRNGQWYYEASANPAWITYDILTNDRYGGGADRSRLDLDAWIDWAEHCDTEKLSFNGVFDTVTNVWDAVNEVARCGHAQVVSVGTRYSVLVERADTPSMMFNVGNMVSGSFKETWLPMADRSNEIELTYFDQDDNYAERTIRVLDTAAQAAGQAPRKSQIQIRGITSKERAYQEAVLALNLNRYIRRTITFSAPLDALACTVGSVILVQHSMPQWGSGGRTGTSTSGSVIQLDSKVTIESGKDYELLLHLDAVQRWTGTVKSIVGTTVLLNGFDGAATVRRFLNGSDDHEVLSIETIGSDHGVRLADVTGITVGSTSSLFDTNVIVRRSVLNTVPAGQFIETDTVTLTASVGTTPPSLTKWVFGPVSKNAKPFRVRKITGSHEYTRELEAVEYNEAIYDATGLDIPDLNYSSLEPAQVKSVVIDGVSEEQVLVGTVFIPQVTINFHGQQDSYRDAEIFLSRNGGPFLSVGRDKSGLTISAIKGEQLDFKVVASNQTGASQAISAAAASSYTVQGRQVDPGAVTGLSHAFTATGTTFKWSSCPLPDWIRTEVRTGAPSSALSAEVFSGKLTQTELPPVSAAGTYPYFFRHVLPDSLDGAFTQYNVAVAVPNTPAPAIVVNGAGSVTISWPSSKTSQTLTKHRIRFGSTSLAFSSLTDAAVISGNTLSHTIVFNAIGTFRVWVQAEDIGGLVSAPGYVDVTVANLGQKGDQGDPGAPGTPGLRSTYVTVYAWAPNVSSLPSLAGPGTYTWASGAITGIPSGWAASPGTTPSAGYSLFRAQVFISDTTTGTQKTVDWTQAQVAMIGVAGVKGDTGNSGAAGASQRVAYAIITGSTIGNTPSTIQTAGSTSFPAANTWGQGETWQGTIAAYSANQSVVKIDGIYDPITDKTTWGSPYLANFKVGSLSAISANLGTITAGSLDIGAGRFQVSSSGYLVARGVQILDESGNVILSTRSGASANLPSGWVNAAPNWLNTNIALGDDGRLYNSGAQQGQVKSLPVVDNDRYTNQPPSYYAPAGAGVYMREFKQRDAIGLPGTAAYWVTLETIGQYSASSGAGYVIQYAYAASQTFRRNAGDNNAWGPWVQDLDRNSYTGDLNATNGAPSGTNVAGASADSVIRQGYPITSGNIDVYMGALAVKTLQIADQAVTIPVSAYTAGSINAAQYPEVGVQRVIQSATINSSGAPIFIFAGVYCSGAPNLQNIFYIYRDGTLLQQYTVTFPGTSGTGYLPLSIPPIVDIPGAGIHTYEVKINYQGYAVSNRSLLLLEAKK